MSLLEWIVLAAQEVTGYPPQLLWEVKRCFKRLGIKASKRECATGLAACIKKGWLRTLDDAARNEIRQALLSDDAVPVHIERATGDLDFTVAGAKLYRQATTDLLGRGWEDGLELSVSYYRETHLYCAGKAVLDMAMMENANAEEKPKHIRSSPIGPWCVYWWERYESGYRVELTYGEP